MKKSQFKPPWWQSNTFIYILMFLGFAWFSSADGTDETASISALGAFVIIIIVPFVMYCRYKFFKNNDELFNMRSSELDSLKIEIENVEKKIAEKQSQLSSLEDEFRDVLELSDSTESKKQEYELYNTNLNLVGEDLDKTTKELDKLKADKEILQKEVDELKAVKDSLMCFEEESEMQSYGLFKNLHRNLSNSERYRQELLKLQDKQRELVKNESCFKYDKKFAVDGSIKKGQVTIKKYMKAAIKMFNLECENAINNLTISTVERKEKRIRKAFKDVNTLYPLEITQDYLTSKIDELYLVLDYQLKKQEEKEEQREIKERMREEAKVQKEIENEKKKLLKEKAHFLTEIERLQKNMPTDEQEKINWQLELESLKEKLEELNIDEANILNREQNTRAGYVYIISNIGSFGENIYKIGMTRRLDPQDRINELSSASVPFRFDVHATIFSEDAPSLENALHKAFEDRRINKVNPRKEFFNVSLEEIKEVVENNFSSTVEYTKYAEAVEYRQSLALS